MNGGGWLTFFFHVKIHLLTICSRTGLTSELEQSCSSDRVAYEPNKGFGEKQYFLLFCVKLQNSEHLIFCM